MGMWSKLGGRQHASLAGEIVTISGRTVALLNSSNGLSALVAGDCL